MRLDNGQVPVALRTTDRFDKSNATTRERLHACVELDRHGKNDKDPFRRHSL